MGLHSRFHPLATAALVTLLPLTLALGPAKAQPAEHAHPAHIHNGTCDQLGDVAFPLGDVEAGGPMRRGGMMQGGMMTPGAGMMQGGMMTPGAGMGGQMGQMMGNQHGIGVETSDTVVDVALPQLLQSDHAINVHESAANLGAYIACGDLGGQVMPGQAADQAGTLLVGLRELNGSGYAGIAVLEGKGAQTEVTLYLAHGLTGSSASSAAPATAATPSASTGSTAGAQAVAATIKNFAYSPDPIEVTVGTTVTWTNEDTAPHTVTGTDQSVIKSPVMKQGETFSVTFDKAGTFPYHCEFHPGMKGTVVVK